MGKLPSNILKTAKPGKHADGDGLYLYLKSRDASGMPVGSWVFRFTLAGGRREMGIGSIAEFGLAEARTRVKRLKARQVIDQSFDPIRERENKMREAARFRASPTLAEMADAAFEAHQAQSEG